MYNRNDKKPKKPSNIIYGVFERPPFWISLIQGVQHICVYAISLTFPVLIARAIGATIEQATFLVSMSMIAGGIGAIVQALPRGPVGSGYLCPQVCGPSFLTASILAAKTGGLSLMMGMTVIAGAGEAFFSRLLKRMRSFFPPEITGLIVAMVGITVIRLASMNFLGLDGSDRITDYKELIVAFVTLGLMVGLNVWSKGKIRLFCVLIGMAAGYFAAYILGLISDFQVNEVREAIPVWMPLVKHPGWSFNLHLLVPFIIAMICSSLKSVGDLTTCQRINNEEWKRTDMENISKGILADSTGCMAGGILGGMGQSTSSTNIGLSIATGITSRVVAYVMGFILIMLGFFPKVATVFAIMPKPVLGATLIFALSYMVIAGFQIIMSRMIDARKTFIVGISLIFGLAVDLMPEAFQGVHPWLQPVFSSSLSTATITAVLLNLLFKIGISKNIKLDLPPVTDSVEKMVQFMDKNGRLWGARKDVILLGTNAVNEFLETVIEHQLTDQTINMEVHFDEFNLDIDLYYKGEPLNLPTHRPAPSGLLDNKKEQLKLAGYLIGQYPDKISCSVKRGISHVHLYFEH